MPMVSMQEAAKLAGVGRTTIYRKASQGLLSITNMPDGSRKVDTAELYRVFPPDTPQDAPQDVQGERPNKNMDRELVKLHVENSMLREALAKAEEREMSSKAEVREREKWLQDKVDELTNTIKQIEYKPDPVVLAPVPDPDPPLPPTAEPVPPIAPDPEPTRAWWRRFFSR